MKNTVLGELKKFLIEKSYDPKYGASPLRRTIEEQIEDPLSEDVLKGKLSFGMEIKADIKGDQILFSGKARKLTEALPEVKTEKKLQEAAR